jgi:hypothetical protein
MDHFVARENIKCFSTRLKSALHPNTQSHLQKLLLEEERKLGADLDFSQNLSR